MNKLNHVAWIARCAFLLYMGAVSEAGGSIHAQPKVTRLSKLMRRGINGVRSTATPKASRSKDHKGTQYCTCLQCD
jgi:hypothetical protein